MVLGLQPRSRGCLNLPPLQASGALHASQPVHLFPGLGATQLSAGVRGRRAGSPKLSYTLPSKGPRCHPSVLPPGRWGRRPALPPQRGQGGGGLLEPQAPLESLGAGLWVHQDPSPKAGGPEPPSEESWGLRGRGRRECDRDRDPSTSGPSGGPQAPRKQTGGPSAPLLAGDRGELIAAAGFCEARKIVSNPLPTSLSWAQAHRRAGLAHSWGHLPC